MTRTRSGCVNDGASVALSVPAFIPSDRSDSPAKDKTAAEGNGGRELGPCYCDTSWRAL